MVLLVGLGNPGADYAETRHNIGFMAVDVIHRHFRFSPWREKFQGLTSDGMVDGTKVVLVKPMTFMNLSGQTVGAAARYLKTSLAQVAVIHDDLDLEPGRVKVKTGGGSGGHNGLKSIDAHLGRDYRRVRLGIGHPGDKTLVTGYVLHPFAKADRLWLEPLLDKVADALPLLVAGKDTDFMNTIARQG